MAIIFPPSPAPGTRWPADPGTPGVTQYVYTGTKWNVVPSLVSLGSANQDAYNAYKWPLADGVVAQQLTTDGAGNLSWGASAVPSMQILGLLEPFDGVLMDFTLVEPGSLTPYIPSPSTNIVVFLGGVPQLPTTAYLVNPGTSTIAFTAAPSAGTTFYAISNVVI